MQRSLRFSFFLRHPTRPTPSLTSPLKVKHSGEQVSLRKSLETLHSLPHCFSLRSFSSLNREDLGEKRSQSPTRQRQKKNARIKTRPGRLIEDLSQYKTSQIPQVDKKILYNLSTSFHSAMVKEDLEEALGLLEHLKRRKRTISENILMSVAVHLNKNDQRAFVERLFQQTEGDDPSLPLLITLLYCMDLRHDYTLLDQVVSRIIKSSEFRKISDRRLSFMFHHLGIESLKERFSLFRDLLIFIRTHTGMSFTRSFWRLFDRLGELLCDAHQKGK